MKKTLKVLGAVVAASALFAGCKNDTDNSDIVQAIMTSAATTQKVSVENKLAAPEVFATIDNSGVALLKWNPVLGATNYQVFASCGNMKNWWLDGSTTNTFYKLGDPVSLNEKYRYKVVALGVTNEAASATEGEIKSPEKLSAIKALDADSIEVTENAVIKNAFDVKIKMNPAASYCAYLTPNTGDADLNLSNACSFPMSADGLAYSFVDSEGKISEGTWRFTITSNSVNGGEVVLTVVETPYNSTAFAANKVVSTKKFTLTPSFVSSTGMATAVRTSPTSVRVKFTVYKINGKEADATYDVYRTETKNGVTGAMSLIGQAKKSYSAEGSSTVEYAFDDEKVAAVDNKDRISSYTYTVVAKAGSTTSAITTVQFNVNSASSDSATAMASNYGLLYVAGVTVPDEYGISINKSEVNMTVIKTKNSKFKVYVASFSTKAEAENALPSEVTTEITSDFKAVESPLSTSSSTTDGVITDEGIDYYELNNYSLDAGVTVQNNVEYSSGYELVKNETKTTNTGKFYVFKMVTTREGYQDVVSIKKAYVTKHITVTKVGDAEPTKHESYNVSIR